MPALGKNSDGPPFMQLPYNAKPHSVCLKMSLLCNLYTHRCWGLSGQPQVQNCGVMHGKLLSPVSCILHKPGCRWNPAVQRNTTRISRVHKSAWHATSRDVEMFLPRRASLFNTSFPSAYQAHRGDIKPTLCSFPNRPSRVLVRLPTW